MRYLIVNGDDFGAGSGVNRGVIDAHRRGILTSASLMVDTPWSTPAARLALGAPSMSVGLHLDLECRSLEMGGGLSRRLRAEVIRQVSAFESLLGRLPTHLDTHHNVHRDPRLLPSLLDLAGQFGLPLREHSLVRHVSKFYGRWKGETHREQISTEGLARILEAEIDDGIHELSCHPGYVDPDHATDYAEERELELRTLCDPVVGDVLASRSIQLVSYHSVGRLAGAAVC